MSCGRGLSFGDPLFGHTFFPLTLYTVSVIGFLASEYSLGQNK